MDQQTTSESQPARENTISSGQPNLCRRCQKHLPASNDGYCWLCGPVVRAEQAHYISCPKCGHEWAQLESSGICRDCEIKAENEKLERHKRRITLGLIIGGDEAVKKYTFENLTRVDPGDFNDGSGPFCGNVLAIETMMRFNTMHHSAYLWGPPGAGKSHIALATVATCHMKGFKVAVYSPRELINRFKVKDQKEEAAEMARCVALDLILINDMGISKITGWAMELICEIFDRRIYKGKKGIIITSNLFIDDLGRKYEDDRLPSRVSEHSTFLEVNPGRDWRVPQ